MLEWSYALLSEAEQRLLDRLSVFRGPFGLDAAEGVCAGQSVSASDIVDLIHQLVVRSLVVADASQGRSRYRLLEPVRQFARNCLADAGQLEAVQDAHALWYLELLSRIDAGWRAGDDQRCWPVARDELSNLRAAFDRLVSIGRTDDAQRFVVAAYGPIVMHFDLEPEFDWAPRACEMAPDHIGPWTARARAMAAWGSAKRADMERATVRARGALDALAAGSADDGLVTISVAVLPLFGGPSIAPGSFFRRARQEALDSGDLNRIVWVLTFTNRAGEAVPYARRQGNLVNLAIAMRAARVFERPTSEPLDRNELEEIAEIATRSCSSTTRNNAMLDLALYDLGVGEARRACSALAFLARDWLHRGDARTWTALAAIAVALDQLGEHDGAVDLATACADQQLLRHPLFGDLGERLVALRDADRSGRDPAGQLGGEPEPPVEDVVDQAAEHLAHLGIEPAA